MSRFWKKTKRYFSGWGIRLGWISVFGKCPVCKANLRFMAFKDVRQMPDGLTHINVQGRVGCPTCGYVMPRSEPASGTEENRV